MPSEQWGYRPVFPTVFFYPRIGVDMRNLILSCLLLAIALSLSARAERMVARIENPPPDLLERFQTQGADIAAYRPGQYLDLVVDATTLTELRREFSNVSVTQTEQQLKENLRPARDLPGYRSYAQMVTELMQLQAQYPSLMSTSVIGTGWGATYADQNIASYLNFDHDLWMVKVSANVQATEDEPAFFFVGEHHAREPLSTEVCMGILIHLLENYGTDPVVTNILNTSEIWIVPLLNPDGHKIVTSETDVWWRKNIRDNNSNQSFDSDDYGSGMDGVDLNRNYGYYWGYTSATDYMPSATYHGLAPFSEPETQAWRDVLLSKRFLAGIGYHTYGEYVLYPYGYVNGITAPDQAELQALANAIAAVLPAMSGGTYDPGPSWGLYPVSGSLDDWAYGETAAFSYTIEMAQQFIPPASQLPALVQNQVNGAMILLQRQDKKILRGHVTDAVTGEPVVARIFVDGLDDQPVARAAINSEPLYGAYYYLLAPGTYSVRYFCPGYETATRSVTISAQTPTIEDVALSPTQPYDLNILILGDFFSPLAGATLTINSNPDSLYVSDANGSILLSGFYPGQYQIRVAKAGFETLNITRQISTPDISLRITSQPVFADDFEINLNNWTTSGSWNRTTSEHYYGAYCLTDSPSGNYQNNANSFCRLTAPIYLQNVENANLQFWVKTELALDDDALLLEYSLNGNTWQYLSFYAGNQYWALQSINLNSLIGQNVYLRFRLVTGSSGSGNGVFIDGVKIYATTDVTTNDDPLLPKPGITLSVSPNPFKDSSLISLKTATGISQASIGVYNLRGQLVRILATNDLTKGAHTFNWDGRDDKAQPAANGIYLIRVSQSGETLSTAKIARIR